MTRSELRTQAEVMIERLIDLLDALDGDTDSEDDSTGEPWLGWTKTGALGNGQDLEEMHCAEQVISLVSVDVDSLAKSPTISNSSDRLEGRNTAPESLGAKP